MGRSQIVKILAFGLLYNSLFIITPIYNFEPGIFVQTGLFSRNSPVLMSLFCNDLSGSVTFDISFRLPF